MNRIREVLANIFLVQIAIIFILLTVSAIHEKYFWTKKEDIYWRYNQQKFHKKFPYIMFKSESGFNTGFQDVHTNNQVIINELGYRGEVPSKEKNHTYRIFILGASTVFGLNNDIASSLQYLLNKKSSKKIKVYNWGVPASVAAQDLARIVYEIVDYHPNLIIMYNGSNELALPFSYDPRPGYPFNYMWEENNPIAIRDFTKYPAFDLMLFRSTFLRDYFSNYFIEAFSHRRDLRKTNKYKSEEWLNKIAETYWKTTKKAAVVSRAFGIDFITVFQPQLVYKDILSEEEKGFLVGINVEERLRLRELVRDFAKNDKTFNFFDESDIFDQTASTVFTDYVHIKDDHTEDVAKALEKHMVLR